MPEGVRDNVLVPPQADKRKDIDVRVVSIVGDEELARILPVDEVFDKI